MKDYGAGLSEIEYEQLPPALRRKYFSSLERLRLAQDGVCSSNFTHDSSRPSTAHTTNPTSTLSRRPTRGPSTNLDERLISSSPSVRKKLRKPSLPGRSYSITPQEVAHFASLPPALQRKQFSHEEQVLLASKFNTVILDAADERLYRQCSAHRARSLPRVRTSRSTNSLVGTSDNDNDNSSMDFTPEDVNRFKWLDEEANIDLSLDEYHNAVTETAQKKSLAPRPSVHRRTNSSSSMSFHRRSSSNVSRRAIANWPLPAEPLNSSASLAAPSVGNHRKNRASTSSLEPVAAHYQDPAARMKLRVYLASPQKFDEAIEFGFPSMKDHSSVPPPRSSVRSTTESARTFFHDDTPSLSSGEDPESEEVDGPKTPETLVFSHSASQKNSLERPVFRPRVVRDFSDSYIQAPSSSREMTLHLTLTRPDLRAVEEKPPVPDVHVNSIPLERPPLVVTDSQQAFWDSLPDDESKVKKMLRKLKLCA